MPGRARVCPEPGCPELQPCPTHARTPWAGSTRGSRLPPQWRDLRAKILRRDQRICHICGGPGADAVDHLQAGDDHSPSNLAAVHQDIPPYCHRRKSSAEGHAARHRRETP